jgi:hypothetical protein
MAGGHEVSYARVAPPGSRLFTSRAIGARRSIDGMTTHAPTSLTLPAPRDYASAASALYDASEAVDSVKWRVREIADAYENDVQLEQPPSLADVGALWAFVEAVDLIAQQLATKRDELRRELTALNLERLDRADELTSH